MCACVHTDTFCMQTYVHGIIRHTNHAVCDGLIKVLARIIISQFEYILNQC